MHNFLTRTFIKQFNKLITIPSLAQWLERSAVDNRLETVYKALNDTKSAETERFPVRIWGEGSRAQDIVLGPTFLFPKA